MTRAASCGEAKPSRAFAAIKFTTRAIPSDSICGVTSTRVSDEKVRGRTSPSAIIPAKPPRDAPISAGLCGHACARATRSCAKSRISYAPSSAHELSPCPRMSIATVRNPQIARRSAVRLQARRVCPPPCARITGGPASSPMIEAAIACPPWPIRIIGLASDTKIDTSVVLHHAKFSII
jgi:hypothetical protein